MRAPSLTELYATGSFIGSLQSGLTFLRGDPEQIRQIDIGMIGDYGDTRLRANGFYSWIRDFIIYDDYLGNLFPFNPGQQFQDIAFGNTDLATLAGNAVKDFKQRVFRA